MNFTRNIIIEDSLRMKAQLAIIAALTLLLSYTAHPTTPKEMVALGEKSFDNRDYEGALNWFSKAAESGEPTAYLGMGILYSEGLGCEVDSEAAMVWLSKSAESGDTGSYYWMGTHYSRGEGVDTNYSTAFSWYQKHINSEMPWESLFDPKSEIEETSFKKASELIVAERYEEAEILLTRSYNENPRDAILLANLLRVQVLNAMQYWKAASLASLGHSPETVWLGAIESNSRRCDACEEIDKHVVKMMQAIDRSKDTLNRLRILVVSPDAQLGLADTSVLQSCEGIIERYSQETMLLADQWCSYHDIAAYRIGELSRNDFLPNDRTGVKNALRCLAPALSVAKWCSPEIRREMNVTLAFLKGLVYEREWKELLATSGIDGTT